MNAIKYNNQELAALEVLRRNGSDMLEAAPVAKIFRAKKEGVVMAHNSLFISQYARKDSNLHGSHH